jgi:formate/nitrite transporter FocA (FNT family)
MSDTPRNKAERPSSKAIYDVVRRNGEEELERPASSLMWSGIAAGILISFSVLTEAILRSGLPDAPWRFLVENVGYSFGFLLVILGRMQLFTENTITTVLPVAARREGRQAVVMTRLWAIVLAANLVGALIAAAFMAYSGAFSGEILAIVRDLSQHATGWSATEAFARAVPAGILIAALVWMMPAQTGNDVLLIVLFTWLIAIGDFAHVIAGSVEMWFLILLGELEALRAAFSFFMPVLLGNIIGGTAVFTLLAWAQVQAEVDSNGE